MMQVIVEAKNLEVTEGLRAHAKKLASKLAKLNRKIVKVHVTLEAIKKKSNDPQANEVVVVIQIPGKDIVVKKRAVDMYEAMNLAFSVAERDMRKAHEKQVTKQRQTEE